DPAFNVEQEAAIKAAFKNWENAGGSNIRFVFETHYAHSVNPQGGRSPAIGVHRGGLQDPDNHLGETTLYLDNAQHAEFASTGLNEIIMCAQGYTNTTSHEIGHTFGLADCPYCHAGTSAMVSPANGPSGSNGLPGPGVCDQHQIRTLNGYTGPGGGG